MFKIHMLTSMWNRTENNGELKGVNFCVIFKYNLIGIRM